MPGTNPQSIENVINRHGASGDGVVVSRCFPDPLCWAAYDTAATPDLQGLAGTLTVAGYTADKCGAGLPNGQTTSASFNVLQFNGTCDSAHSLACEIPLTEHAYVPVGSNDPPRRIVMKFGVRQVGSGTVTDGLNLTIKVYAKVPGSATFRTLSDTFAYTLPAKVSTLTFEEFEMDLGNLMDMEGLGAEQYLVENAIVKVVISVDDAVGTNMAVEILPLSFQIREHLVTNDVEDRKPLSA